MRTAAYDSMDTALDVLSAYGPDLSNGMTSHAPMAAEALCAMGRPAAVLPFLESYRELLLPRPATRAQIGRDQWRAALSQSPRFADWSARFAAEMDDEPWRAVLDRWVDRLTPGICASATHGVIRVGHAVRSLAAEETPLRRRELADALAPWAAEYQELPTHLDATSRGLSPREAIRAVDIVPADKRRFSGSIVSALTGLSEYAPFADAIGLLDVDGDPAAMLDDLSETFARVYLANAEDFLTTIVFVHGVTGVAALGNIAPHVGTATVRRAARYAWQAGCGLYAAFARRPPQEGEVEPPREDDDALIDLAIASRDEHAIKFAEACLAQHARRPSAVYPAAVRHAVGALHA